MNHREWRERDGDYWGFVHLLRAFAATNQLPRPEADYKPDVYDQQVVRDLFERHGVTASTAGEPLAHWDQIDRGGLPAGQCRGGPTVMRAPPHRRTREPRSTSWQGLGFRQPRPCLHLPLV
jgi:hypothetical protein